MFSLVIKASLLLFIDIIFVTFGFGSGLDSGDVVFSIFIDGSVTVARMSFSKRSGIKKRNVFSAMSSFYDGAFLRKH